MSAANMHWHDAIRLGYTIVRSKPSGLAYMAVADDGTKYRLFWCSPEAPTEQLDRQINRQQKKETK